mgnify:CR=1 FL=1
MNFLNYLLFKMRQRNGESNTISIAGWCVIASLVVIALMTKLPNLISDLIGDIFSNFSTKLGV